MQFLTRGLVSCKCIFCNKLRPKNCILVPINLFCCLCRIRPTGQQRAVISKNQYFTLFISLVGAGDRGGQLARCSCSVFVREVQSHSHTVSYIDITPCPHTPQPPSILCNTQQLRHHVCDQFYPNNRPLEA